MRSFWGLMRAYWFSDRWMEAWALTVVIAFFTAAASKASVAQIRLIIDSLFMGSSVFLVRWVFR